MSDKGKQVTWGGRFSDGPSELMLRIGESVSFDQAMARFDVQGSQAQAAMLVHISIGGSDFAEFVSGLPQNLLHA